MNPALTTDAASLMVGLGSSRGRRSSRQGGTAISLKFHSEAVKETVDDWFSESTVVEITPF